MTAHNDTAAANLAEDRDAAQRAQSELVEEFAFFDDWTERYRHIIDMGKALPELEDNEKIDDNLVRGCQSQVWFVLEKDAEGRLMIRATSDAMIVKGLIAMLLRVYNGRLSQTIANTPPDFIEALGLQAHLSPTRNNGLLSMVKRLQAAAAAD